LLKNNKTWRIPEHKNTCLGRVRCVCCTHFGRTNAPVLSAEGTAR
jgi:hypothetical protein